MPSRLRIQSSFEEPIAANATFQHTSPSPSTSPPAKKQKMSLTQTYYVASTARSKLGHEAQRPDHNLRLLVGHANLLDSLMLELADAEREQEAWFSQSVKKADEQPKHIQWIDTIDEAEDEDDDSDMESDDGSDIYDEDVELFNIPLRKIRSPPVSFNSTEVDDEEDEEEDAEYDDDEYDAEHALVRVASQHSPPELTLDSDSESDEEPCSPEPQQEHFELSEKQRQAITTTAFYDDDAKSQQGLEDYMMQQPRQQPMIATC